MIKSTSKKTSKKVSLSKSMKRPSSFIDRHFWLITAFGLIIILVSLLVIKKVEYKKKLSRYQYGFPTSRNGVVSDPNPEFLAEVKDGTQGTKEYFNHTVGFSFSFPEQYTIDDGGGSGYYFSVHKFNKTEDEVWPIPAADLKLEMWFTEKKYNSVEDFMYEYNNTEFQKEYYESIDYQELSQETVTFGGKEGVKIVAKTQSGTLSYYYFLHNGIGIQLLKQPETTLNHAEFDQIISTFQFN